MRKLNYGFGAVSLILGLGLMAAVFSRGLGLSLGLVLGGLLALNGVWRLWLARQRPSARPQGNAFPPPSPPGQDKG